MKIIILILYRIVFLVPPWEEIFKGDTERKHNFESAKKEFDELLIKYYGEHLIVPVFQAAYLG
jgi:predicted ATPase